MPLPSVTFRSELDPIVRKELDQFDGELTGYLLEEHDDDGHHTHVTADALTIKGPVTITGGPLLVDGVPITGGDEVRAHAPTHESGGTDPVSVTALAGYPGGTTAFLRADRSFVPLPPTLPTPHHLSHLPGAADPIPNVAWVDVANTFQPNQRINGQLAVNTVAADLWVRAPSGYYERNRSVLMGEWQAVPYNAADFTADTGTWTVSAGAITYFRYTLIGKTITMSWYLNGTTTNASMTWLNIKIPGSFVAAGATMGGIVRFLEPAQSLGMCYVAAGSNLVSMHKVPLVGIPANSNLSVQGVATFEIG
jgi:hypothetical protein